MMPVIRISDQTWERLKGYARPLEDSAEDVVRRALDALDERRGVPPKGLSADINREPAKDRRKPHGEKLPQKQFRDPLLSLLYEKGGRASTGEIREGLEPRIAARLTKPDYEKVSSGDPRWWNAACWERNELVKEGLLRADSPRGIWELSDRGLELAKIGGRRDPDRMDSSAGTWRDDLVSALKSVDEGGGARLEKIYEAVKKIRQAAGRSVPPSLKATVRRTLEDNCANSDNFRGVDVFIMPNGKGAGVWGLRDKANKR
jgi:hypothetical protein